MEIPFFLLQPNIPCIHAVVLFNFSSEAVSLILWHFKWFLFASLPSDCAFSYDPSLPICFLKYQRKLIETFNVISRTENTVIKACWDVSLLWSHTIQQKYLLGWGGCWWEKIWEERLKGIPVKVCSCPVLPVQESTDGTRAEQFYGCSSVCRENYAYVLLVP